MDNKTVLTKAQKEELFGRYFLKGNPDLKDISRVIEDTERAVIAKLGQPAASEAGAVPAYYAAMQGNALYGLFDSEAAAQACIDKGSPSVTWSIKPLYAAPPSAPAAQPSQTEEEPGEWIFDRYIGGKLMAEGVVIERQKDMGGAMRAAAAIASKGPHGEAPVLVLRAAPPAPSQQAAPAAESAEPVEIDDLIRELERQPGGRVRMAAARALARKWLGIDQDAPTEADAQGDERATTRREEINNFGRACELLPDQTRWGDKLLPWIVLHIEQAALSRQPSAPASEVSEYSNQQISNAISVSLSAAVPVEIGISVEAFRAALAAAKPEGGGNE